ncbi:MAG: hypothetical protein CMM31_05905 [Rhodospirillaceae bacterium]|nr:hypothetical protein [Rhodospirillaceae bacterium]
MKKKLLLGTTAIIAAGVATSGVAQAAEEPIEAGISGYFRTAMAMISQDNGDGELADAAQSHSIGNDIEITVSGSTTLDNGITAGFSAQIEGNGATAGSEALDERFVFFRGGFGQIRVGQVESARQDMTQFAPSGNYNFGVNSPFFIFGNPGNGSGIFNVRTYDDGLGDEDNIKLVYFSPTFNGFRLGASYSPEDGVNGQYGGNAGDAAAGLQNNLSAAIEYNNNFGDFAIRLMAGMEQYVLERCNASAATQTCENNPTSTQWGGQISFGSWAIGGGYLETEQITHSNNGTVREREDWDLGVSYWAGNYGIGLAYGSAEVDQATNDTDSFEIMELNATYVLGPGIDVGAAIRKGEFDDATTGANLDNEFTEVGISAALSF